MNTCDKCKNWTAEDLQDSFPEYKDQGYCSLFGDVNKGTPDNTVCYGEDYECYRATVVVMAKFGCIHWKGKEK